MKALVINKPGELQVKDLPTPAIGADEVLVRMRAVGICHSDYELYSGKYIIPIDYPVIPGHEWSGEVVETGKAVSGLKPGDPVVGECVIESGEEVDHFGFSINGAYSQLFKARPEWLHKLPEGVSFKTGALVEPFTCGYYAIEANGRTNGSETVIVSGGGNIGLCAAAAARGMGARVILVDPLPLRRAAAEKIGVDVTVDPSAGDAVAKVLELTGGKGADLVIEASGHDSSLAAVLDYVRTGGRVTFVGISIGRKIPVELGKIQGKSLTIKGTIGSPGVWPAAMRFLARTKLNLSPISDALLRSHQGHRSLRIRKESEGVHQSHSDQRSVRTRSVKDKSNAAPEGTNMSSNQSDGAVVTGAASGIGRAIAAGLAADGFSVVIADLDEENGRAAAEEIAASNQNRAIFQRVDVTNRTSVSAAIDACTRQFGSIKVMVNNAGFNKPEPFLEASVATWHKVMDVNALGVLIGIQEAAKTMIAAGTKGKIINTASIAGRTGYADFAPYCASKFAVVALTHAGARALAGKGITVNAFAPGVVATPLWEQLDKDLMAMGVSSAPGEAMENFSRSILLGRVAQPSDVVGTVRFLASPASDYMTGQVLMIDGGMILQ